MKPIAVVFAVGSLLTAPVVFAQSTPQSTLLPGAAAPNSVSRESDFYAPPSRGSSASPKDALRTTESADPNSATVDSPRGSFEGTGSSEVKGSFEGTGNMAVQGSFEG